MSKLPPAEADRTDVHRSPAVAIVAVPHARRSVVPAIVRLAVVRLGIIRLAVIAARVRARIGVVASVAWGIGIVVPAPVAVPVFIGLHRSWERRQHSAD